MKAEINFFKELSKKISINFRFPLLTKETYLITRLYQ